MELYSCAAILERERAYPLRPWVCIARWKPGEKAIDEDQGDVCENELREIYPMQGSEGKLSLIHI